MPQTLPVSTGSPPGKGTPLQSDLRQLQEHHIKINVLPADAEEGREGAQLPEAEFFIQPDGADIVAAHLDIELGKAVFPRKGKDSLRQGRGRTAAPPRPLQADAEHATVAHPAGLAVQAGRADELAVHSGKILHMVRRIDLCAQIGLLLLRRKRHALCASHDRKGKAV